MHAQYSEKDFIRYTVKDELNDNYITCLQQDDQGYIWAGTDIGLNRFDGSMFKKIYPFTLKAELVPGAIRAIKNFGKNQLGIVSRNGFQILNTTDFSVKNYFITDTTAFKVQLNDVWDAAQLPNQFVALSTSSGFYVFGRPGKLHFRHDAYFLKDVGKQRIFYGREIFNINEKEYLVYNEEKGLSYYNAAKKIFQPVPPNGNEWSGFSHPAADGEQWISKFQLNLHEFIFAYHYKDSIVYYDHSIKKKVTSALPFDPSLHLSWESRIVTLNDSCFFINDGTRGFYSFHVNRKTGKISSDGKKLMPDNKVTCLFVDKDKRLWVGTDAGLFRQKLSEPFITGYQYKPTTDDQLTGGFSSVYRYKNKLYVGRYSLFNGLIVLDAETMQPEKQLNLFTGNNNSNEVLSMQMYHPDTLWLGTNGGLLWLDTKTDHYGKLLDEKKYPWAKNFSGILAAPRGDGYAWICSYLGGIVIRYHIASRTFTVFTSTTQPSLPFDKVKSIIYDSYGDVWVGGHSLARWNNHLQSFDTLISIYGGINKFNDDILTLEADNNGSLWLHNAFNGLLEYRIKEKKFIAYTMANGLPSEVLQSFSPVIGNDLWIGSNSHLSKFDTRTKKTVVFDQYDGLPEHRPSERSMFFDQAHDLLYMCAGDYLVKILIHSNPDIDNSSNLLIQELIVNNINTLFQPAAGIELKYNENNLSLNYTVIDFEKNNYQFAYKLNNEGNWNSLGKQRTLNLNNLQPGKYDIRLKATGKAGNEKTAAIILIIQPPFWKTTWFLLGCILLAAAALSYLYRYRIKQVKQKANIDKLLAQTEMKALHSQMNPHFIFNSLNSIREMILNNENKEASRYLSKFAQLIRITLDQSGQSFISLRNTLDYLQRYIEMEKIRNSHFTYSINIDPELDPDETLLPPMLIQPFIENAIWHGVSVSNKKIHINIDFKKQDDQLVCIIDDDGIGIDQSLKNRENKDSLHNPVGIINIKNRIRVLNEKYNLQSDIDISDKKNSTVPEKTGTLVTLYLPLEINEEWIR